MDTTAGVYLDTQPAKPNKPSGMLSPTPEGDDSRSAPVASMEAAPRRISPVQSGDVSGPLSVTLTGTDRPHRPIM